MSKKQKAPPTDAFTTALRMLAGDLPAPCPTCGGRGWFLGRITRQLCHVCRGEGVRW